MMGPSFLFRTLIAFSMCVSAPGASIAQRGSSVASNIDRVTQSAGKAQERAERAQDRLENIPSQVDRAVGRAQERAAAAAMGLSMSGRELATSQSQRFRDLVRSHPLQLEMTRLGPAVRAQILAIDPPAETLVAVRAAGFTVLAEEVIEGLELRSVTLEPPRGMSIQRALSRLARIAPSGEFTANHLHIQSGVRALPLAISSVALAQAAFTGPPSLGIIDGGVAAHPSLKSGIQQRGFASGAPFPNAHATAVASLAVGQAGTRGAFPGGRLLVGDIYGRDPAGGNALALVRALGWMAEQRTPVVAISLAGPNNPLVARAIARAQSRGMFIVAPVGNSGPAAPFAYPAAYPRVVAVTGVDARNRVLIEAGRLPSLSFAAPGADMVAADLSGGVSPVRGTSFAVPLVAGRLVQAVRSGVDPLTALDREAVKPKEGGSRHGRGIICGECRTAR